MSESFPPHRIEGGWIQECVELIRRRLLAFFMAGIVFMLVGLLPQHILQRGF
jgi:hypothetical protein